MSLWDNIVKRAKDTCDDVRKEFETHNAEESESAKSKENHADDVLNRMKEAGIPVIDVHDSKEAFEKAAEPIEGEVPLKEEEQDAVANRIMGFMKTACDSLKNAADKLEGKVEDAGQKEFDFVKKEEPSASTEKEGGGKIKLGTLLKEIGERFNKEEPEDEPKVEEKPSKKDDEPRFCGMSIETLNKLKVVRIIHAREDGTTLIRVKGIPVAYILDGESFKDTGKWAWKISQKVFLNALKQQTKKHSSKSVSEMVGGLFKKK